MSRSDWKQAQAEARNERAGDSRTLDPRLQGAELKYGGRTLEIQIFINTDEELSDIAERLRAPAAGPELRMIAILGREIEPELAAKLWASTWDAAVETIRRQS